jgi:hypothetical protein
MRKIYAKHRGPSLDRHTYFRSLLELQAELIKLQDWVDDLPPWNDSAW